MSNTWSLLVVSDIHYESQGSEYPDDPKQLKWNAFREKIFTSFKSILCAFPEKLDLIAVVGDITTRGSKKGIERFSRDTLPTLRKLIDDPEAICIVPGNHDVEWGADPTETNFFNEKFEAFRWLADSECTCCLFPDGRLTENIDDDLRFLPPKRSPIYLNKKRKLLAMCINSSMRCGEFNKQMYDEIVALVREERKNKGFSDRDADSWIPGDSWEKLRQKYFIRDVAHITQPQRTRLSDELDKIKKDLGDEWASYLRIAILHHHLVHFPRQIIEHRDYEFLVDSSHIVSLLVQFDFDIALTGHKHQSYEVKHLEDGKELLILGGPTLGGHSAGESFRGVRWIKIEDQGDSRKVNFRDIDYGNGNGNAKDNIMRCDVISKPWLSLSSESYFETRSKLRGFSYRGIASITRITPDGDAFRVVECEGFKAENNCKEDRSRYHPIRIPSTSGYLANLKASAKEFKVEIQKGLPRKRLVNCWETVLKFSQQIGICKPADYTYQWYAVNSFALDRRQFDYMYGLNEPLHDVEFTHFATADPIEELTVMVSFPSGFSLKTPPRVRVAKVDLNEKDARKWEVDSDTEHRLSQSHAFRYYESLNVASLRVRSPLSTLIYGIEWDVPDAAVEDEMERDTIKALREFAARRFTDNQRDALVKTLARVIQATRESFSPGWRGPIEANMWLFDGKRKLVPLVAAVSGEGETRGLKFKASLAYGMGIAGRAFKANRLRVYVAPETSESDEPDYYIPLKGLPARKVVLCLPMHIPAQDDSIKSDAQLYESKVPYAVMSLSSERGDCPLGLLRLPENIPRALFFQHRMNDLVFQSIRDLMY